MVVLVAGRPRGRAGAPKAGSGVDEEGRWTPVFAGQREPFQEGNEVCVTHGAYVAPERLGERVHEIAAAVRPFVPGYSPVHEVLVTGYAVALVRVERASAALAAVEDVASDRHQKLEKNLRLWLSTVIRFAAELGLSPASAARITRDMGIGVQAAAAHAQFLERYRGTP